MLGAVRTPRSSKPSDDAIGSITLHTALVEKPRQVIELVSRPRVGVVLVTSVDVG